jgi:hypothetical protein
MAEVSRRQALAGLGSVSLATVIAACSDDENEASTESPRAEPSGEFDKARTCTVTAEQTEGPFYFDVDEIRGDIREDREGAELRLGVRVRDAAESNRDGFNSSDGLYDEDLELTLSREGGAYRGRITLDVERA